MARKRDLEQADLFSALDAEKPFDGETGERAGRQPTDSSQQPISKPQTSDPSSTTPLPGGARGELPARLAEVAVEGPVKGTFTYTAEGLWDKLTPGTRVKVPFGHRTLGGFFVGEKSREQAERDGINLAKLKAIIQIVTGEKKKKKEAAKARTGEGASADAPAQQPTANSQQLSTSQEPISAQALLTPTLLSLANWMSRHYAAPVGATLSAMLPAGVKRGQESQRVRMVTAKFSPEELLTKSDELAEKKPKQAIVLRALGAFAAPTSAAAILAETQAPDSALKALEKAGLITISESRIECGAHSDGEAALSQDLKLNSEQQAALDAIEKSLGEVMSGENRVTSDASDPVTRQSPPVSCHSFLLQGVTGSGKTEVYIRALKTALSLGKQGIVLVPEIALTPQTAQRFESRLGRERVAVLHSHITDGDRAEAWRAIRAGKIDVVVGARSALFAPLPRLGLIVIDEEHESAFKQESTPRYHARDVAMELARLSNAVLVLGSATPSFEAIYAAKSGRLKHLFLNERVAGRPMPPVEIVDMNNENRETKKFSYLSRRLLRALDETLSRREQAILFMNRRGFSTVITCNRCGHTEKCDNCDITLTSHRETATERVGDGATARRGDEQRRETLHCHYCGFSKPVPDFCSGCGAAGVKHWGMGTERVENEVKKLFPSARVARMDSDTMTRRTAYLEALGNFRAGKTDILVGTQMIAKGLDFPNVTLVGVVLADTALHMPDFRSRERTFQLLAQVAGRAGRGEKGGRVIIQTHLPHDPAIRAASTHDFDAFAMQELQERRQFSYPPFTRLARILIRGKDQKATREAAKAAADALKKQVTNDITTPATRHAPPVTILGPAEPPIARIENYFRQHILIKARDSEALAELLNGPAGQVIEKLKGADAVVDVDAVSML